MLAACWDPFGDIVWSCCWDSTWSLTCINATLFRRFWPRRRSEQAFFFALGIAFRWFLRTRFWEGSGFVRWLFWLSFGVPFGNHSGYFLGTVFSLNFRGCPGLSKSQRRAEVAPDLHCIRGTVNQSTEANQLTNMKQISKSTEQLTWTQAVH